MVKSKKVKAALTGGAIVLVAAAAAVVAGTMDVEIPKATLASVVCMK